MKSAIIFFLVVLGTVLWAGGATLVVDTADGGGADSYISYYNQGGNYGTAVSLRLSKNYVPYVKFDLADAFIDTVSNANLSFYGAPADVNDLPGYNYSNIPVYGLLDGSDGWAESTTNYLNAPLVSNPIVAHPYLRLLGTLDYTNGTTAVMSLNRTDTALEAFLNNRGPDGVVTIIIGSDKYTPGSFFLTKEYDSGGSAPYMNLTTGTTAEQILMWNSGTGGSWAEASNWINQYLGTVVPGAGDIVMIDNGDTEPVVIDSSAGAGKLFVQSGELEISAEELVLDGGVLRIYDGAMVDLAGGELWIGQEDQRALMGALIDDGKIVTSVLGKEPYAAFVSDPNYTIVSLRDELGRLRWGGSIVSVSGPVGTGGDLAGHCLDGSGITGDIHARYVDDINSWYACVLSAATEPVLEITFDKAYELGEMWVWNYEDGFKGYALKTVQIEYSTNGVIYSTLMNGAETEFIWTVGNKDGSVNEVVDFGGVEAKYVRITAVGGPGVGNYQSTGIPTASYILRELRFYLQQAPILSLSYPDGGVVLARESHSWDNPAKFGSRTTVDGSGLTGDVHNVGQDFTYWYARTADIPGGELIEPWSWFTFDEVYVLGEMWVWNCDESANESGRALKGVKVEYSEVSNPDEPGDWTVLLDGTDSGEVWHKSVNGQRSDTVDFAGAGARHVRITAVGGYGVGNYGSSLGYVLNELRFYHAGIYQGFKAGDPVPADGDTVNLEVTLGWTAGMDAVTGQDVWFGPAGNMTKVASNLAAEVDEIYIGILDNLTTYEWRVDGLDGVVTAEGDVWSFDTKAWLWWNPGGMGVVGAVSTMGEGGTAGVLAVDQSGMNGDLHDSWAWSNEWYCRKPWTVGVTEPVLDVEFDRIYELSEMWVWNHDGTTPVESPIALKTIHLEYSTDGVNYNTLMNGAEQYFILPHGNTDGTHDTVIDWGSVDAKYVRLTAVGGPGVGNYGSTEWGYKLRELRFYYNPGLKGDLDGDGDVDIDDLALMAGDWLTGEGIGCTVRPGGDASGDCFVDMADFAMISDEWMP